MTLPPLRTLLLNCIIVAWSTTWGIEFGETASIPGVRSSIRAERKAGARAGAPPSNGPLGTRGNKRKLILHIGTHKTGSSYFQTHLEKNEGLSPKIRFPHTCGKPTTGGGFQRLAYLACRPEALPKIGKHLHGNCDARTPEFASEFYEGEDDIIVSSESFDLCTVTGFARLKVMFAKHFDISVVLVRRDSRQHAISHFHQVQKRLSTTADILQALSARGESTLNCFNAPVNCMRTLAKVFGPEKVHVISYEGLRAVGKSLASLLCELFSTIPCYPEINLQDIALDQIESPSINVSPPQERFSSSVIFNRISGANKCQKLITPDSAASMDFQRKLEEIGIEKYCFPRSSVPRIQCDECFYSLAIDGQLQVKTYFFKEGATWLRDNPQAFCSFNETDLQRADNLKKVESAVIGQALCPQSPTGL